MIAIGLLFNGVLFVIGIATMGLQHATGEVLPRYADVSITRSLASLLERDEDGKSKAGRQAWFRRTSKRTQLVALIISRQADALGQALLAEIKRGVTRLEATGVYTGLPHGVLMIALTLTEISHLKAIVSRIDPNAFVIVVPAQEVLGLGFQPLTPEPAPAHV